MFLLYLRTGTPWFASFYQACRSNCQQNCHICPPRLRLQAEVSGAESAEKHASQGQPCSDLALQGRPGLKKVRCPDSRLLKHVVRKACLDHARRRYLPGFIRDLMKFQQGVVIAGSPPPQDPQSQNPMPLRKGPPCSLCSQSPRCSG